jgi:hypothetical protein
MVAIATNEVVQMDLAPFIGDGIEGVRKHIQKLR